MYILQNTAEKNDFYPTLKVENSEVNIQTYTGSTANIIAKNPTLTLTTKSRKRLFAFATSILLQVVGQFQCTIESLNKLTIATVFVVKNATGCLLNGQTAIELDLIRLKVNTATTPKTVKTYQLS